MSVVPFHIQRQPDLAEALSRIAEAGLYLPDENVSRVQTFFDHERTPEGHNPESGEKVLAAWLAWAPGQLPETHPPIGMALVSLEQSFRCEPVCWFHLVNVYVHPTYAGRGLGRALAEQAQQSYPDLKGFYTADSIAIYEALGIEDEASLGATSEALQRLAERHRLIHDNRWQALGISLDVDRSRHYRTRHEAVTPSSSPRPRRRP